MKNKTLLFRLCALVAAMMCALGASAAEAYANYTSWNTTLTFYYDNLRSTRTGWTFDLNEGDNKPDWCSEGMISPVQTVVFDPSFAGARPTSTFAWFAYMSNLQSITGISYLNTSEVTNMYGMFYGSSGLTSLDLSHFNTAKVTDMGSMFSDCSGLTSLDLSNFNTAKVTNMWFMFFGCSGLTSLDLSGFNTANVTETTSMFSGCNNLTTIYAGDGWSTAAETISSWMFSDCTSLVGGMGTTYDPNHVDAAYAHIDGGPSNPGYFTDVNAAMEPYAVYTPENTTLTFYCDGQRNSRPGTTYDLNEGSNFPGWYSDGTRSSVTQAVFDPSFDNARPTTTYTWFFLMENLQSITGIEYLNTTEVNKMGAMFMACGALTSIDLSHFNTEMVTDMFNMFYGCSSLQSLDVGTFNTASVTDMRGMFRDCSALTSLDLTNFDTRIAENTSSMFAGCTSLTTIYAGDEWSTANINYSSDMFNNCVNIKGGKGTTYDPNHVDKAYAHIDGGPSNPGYFTDKSDFLRGDVDGDGFVKISDVTALIDYLLTGNAAGINLDAADCDLDGDVKISDVTELIDYLLRGFWW